MSVDAFQERGRRRGRRLEDVDVDGDGDGVVIVYGTRRRNSLRSAERRTDTPNPTSTTWDTENVDVAGASVETA